MTRLMKWLRPLARRPVPDRRHAPRFAFNDSIEVRMASGTIFRGVARDLSVRGVGAIVYADLEVGDSGVIKYAHPHSPPAAEVVARPATVRARYGSRYGFEFREAMDFGVVPEASVPITRRKNGFGINRQE